MEQVLSALSGITDGLAALLGDYPLVVAWYTAVVRFLFPVLALLILARSIRSLLTVPHLPEVWAYLSLPNGLSQPLTHWENILGRSGASDVVLGYPTVSRQQPASFRFWMTACSEASTGPAPFHPRGGPASCLLYARPQGMANA